MPMRDFWYDSVNGDRPYGSDTWAKMLARLYSDGVFLATGTELKVGESNPPALSVSVAVGAGMVGGRYGELYDAALGLTLGVAHATLPRIDTIVLQSNVDAAVRATRIVVKSGTPATTPLAPALQQDTTVWELPLANVRVNALVTSVTATNITDRRQNVAAFKAPTSILSSNINLLVNGGFEFWSRGAGPYSLGAPGFFYQYCDGWLFHYLGGTGANSVERSTTTVDGSKAATRVDIAAAAVNADIALVHRIEDWSQFKGKPLSFSARVLCSAQYTARVAIQEDGPSGKLTTFGAYHSGDGTWQTLAVTKLLRADNTAVEVRIVFAGPPGTFYADNAMAVIGTEVVGYVPLPPSDDQARTERYFQKLRLHVSGYQTAGQGVAVHTGFRRVMAGTPSVTLGSTTGFGDLNVQGTGVRNLTAIGGDFYADPTATGTVQSTREATFEFNV